MAVLLFLVVIVAVLAMFLLLKRRRLYLLASQLDGPTAWPIIGNGHKMMCDAEGEAKKSC